MNLQKVTNSDIYGTLITKEKNDNCQTLLTGL